MLSLYSETTESTIDMSPVQAGSTGIPRLQELSFLETALRACAAGNPFDGVRIALVEDAGRKRHDSEFDLLEIRRKASESQAFHASNATEALAELMRLRFVEPMALPSTAKALQAYAGRHYRVTEDGERWLVLVDDSLGVAYDQLLTRLLALHPQLKGYVELVIRRNLTIPVAGWIEVHPQQVGQEGRPAYLSFLIKRVIDQLATADLGWSAPVEDIDAALRAYLEARMRTAALRLRASPFGRNRDFVRTCEEALVTFALRSAGLTVDYTSFEILRRWTKDLGVANFSYHVPGPTAIRLWGTADMHSEAERATFERHTGPSWIDRAVSEIPEGFARAQRQERGSSWLSIYKVRAAVSCHLGLSDRVFDEALAEFILRARTGQLPYAVNLDIFDTGQTPPTEREFQMQEASGRGQTYRIINIAPQEPRRAG